MGEPFALVPPSTTVDLGAVLSPCGRYRYRLWRTWDLRIPPVVWVMLNPSTADASVDDPTVRRCMGFARSWGAGGIEVVNLFALRATDPAALRAATDPVGPDNDRYLRDASRTVCTIVAAWGAHVGLHGRDRAVLALLSRTRVCCLGTTAEGHPRHPLYVRGDTALVEVQRG